MYWWMSAIVAAVGVAGLVAAAAVPVPPAARLRRELARWRRDVASATAALRSVDPRGRRRRPHRTGAPSA